MSQQEQFLEVIDRNVAEARFRAVLSLSPLGTEEVLLTAALGRTLAENTLSRIDVPGFDRSNYDGFAVHAADTFGTSELAPQLLRLLPQSLDAGTAPQGEVGPGEAMTIAEPMPL
jgi:putative molybdopterin biosynthesis protein